jgi:hypothetical protein
VIRVCNRLESLGIISQTERMQETGKRRQTSNLIKILPAQLEDDGLATPEKQKSVTPKSSQNPINSKTIINNTYSPNVQTLTSTYARFKLLVNSYVEDFMLTNRIYGKWLAHTSYLNRAFVMLLQAGLQAIKATFQASNCKYLRS